MAASLPLLSQFLRVREETPKNLAASFMVRYLAISYIVHKGALPVKHADAKMKNMTEQVVSPEIKEVFWWDRVGRLAIYLMGFLLPLWVLPIGANPLETSKVSLAYFLILIAFLVWLVGRIKLGSAVLPKNYLALSLIVLAAVWAVSGVFSISRHASFFALSGDPSGVAAIVAFALAAFLAYFYLSSSDRVFIWIFSFFSSAALIFILQFFRLAFGLNFIPWINFQASSANLLGTSTEFGIFFSLVLAMSLFLFEVSAKRPLKLWLMILALMSFAAVLSVNSAAVWWTLFAFLLILMAYFFSFRTPRLNVFTQTFFFLLAVLLFIQIPTLSSVAVSYLGVETLEVRPSWAASWSVLQSVLEENPVVGSGPGTFVYDWLRFKPAAVNLSPFWAARFSAGFGFWPSALATAGILGFAAVIFMAGSFIFYGLKALVSSNEVKSNPVLALVFVAALMLLTYSFIYSPSFILIFLLFLFLGMFMALISEAGLAKEYNLTLFQNSGIGFISSLAIIFLLVATFSAFYFLGQKYAAAYYFGRSLAKGQAGDLSGAEADLSRASGFDKRDQYFRVAVDIGLSQISLLLNRQDLSPDDLRGRFQTFLSQTIQNAQNAVSLNPIDPLNWMTLGRVYEAVIPFQISGASDFAVAAYNEAASRNLTSPEPFFAKARVALASSQIDQARGFLEESIRLKSNYTPAHLLLAQIEDSQGNIKKAILSSEAAAILSPGDIGVLFQLGLLYYRDNQLQNAGQVFARAVELNPNYSNARYFLGLIYDRLGDRDSAVSEFEKIQGLNPDNPEVARVLENLRTGKSALAGISPPGPKPEERKESPVED